MHEFYAVRVEKSYRKCDGVVCKLFPTMYWENGDEELGNPLYDYEVVTLRTTYYALQDFRKRRSRVRSRKSFQGD